MKIVTQAYAAKATGVSRQAIHQRVQAGTLKEHICEHCGASGVDLEELAAWKPKSRGLGRKFDWSLASDMWGKFGDKEIAAAVGCCIGTVTTYRTKLGIAPRLRDRGRYKNIEWVKAEEMWGKFSDRKISEELGCAKYDVVKHRKKHGIKSSIRRRDRWANEKP